MLGRVDELCERCGAVLPAGARFCPRCGAPVAALATSERKIVTVLFADLAHSTELAARLDAERFREVMAEFFGMVSTELESLRGRAEKFIGDAVMAVFGLPRAHEDDALRAIRAALIVRDRVARLEASLALPVPLEVRIGINSGPVATGAGLGDQFLVSGAPVNFAARLQEAAAPGEILAGQTTWQLSRHAVEFGERRLIDARGFDGEVPAWPVISVLPRSSRRTIPMVDRRRELALLVETFQRAREATRAHMVTVLGEAGIGKTRLVEEFRAGLPEDVRFLSGRTNEYEEEATYAPIADMIRRLLGVERGEPADRLRHRLREVVEGCCDPTETDRVTGRLGLVLGLGEDAREGTRYRSAEIRAGFLSFVTGLAEAGPVVLVLDDLHIAQAPLLDLIEQTVRQARQAPVLVLCLARDDLLDERPGWGGGLADSIMLRLEPLAPGDATELARTAGEDVDDATAARIAHQAGGNPFFIIETTGMLLDRHAEHVQGIEHGHVLPPTVQAVVASRIDHLSDEAKDLVRKASVFARSTFSLEELAYIAEPREETVRLLEEAELLVPDPDRPNVWRFRHEMLRDVAYESLPKRERERLHLAVADGLERDAPRRYPRAVAYHLEQAARAALDLVPGDRTLADRAVAALQRAGDLARWRMEPQTAADLYERALALAGPDEAWGRREATILASLGESRYWLGEYEPAAAVLSRALELAGEDLWVQALACRFLGDIALNIRGEVDEAERMFDRALAAARSLRGEDEPWVLARVLLTAGWVPYWRNDLAGARAMFEEALEVARANPQGDRWAEARALTSLTSVISPVGDEAECLELGRQALALGRRMGDPFTIAVAQENVGSSLRRMWQLDEALAGLDEAVRIFGDIGARWELASSLGDRAMIHRYEGRLDAAERDLRDALDLCRHLGERSLVSWTASELVRVLLLRGDVAAARRLFEDSSAILVTEEPGSRVTAAVTESLLALADGDRERAERIAVQALRDGTVDWRNVHAARVWWIGRLFGPDAAGGPDAVEEARATLESAHWMAALREPEQFLDALAAVS
jgi:class 3 adenylate cyclase/tetratricopeptide (TPR) repeat protein